MTSFERFPSRTSASHSSRSNRQTTTCPYPITEPPTDRSSPTNDRPTTSKNRKAYLETSPSRRLHLFGETWRRRGEDLSARTPLESSSPAISDPFAPVTYCSFSIAIRIYYFGYVLKSVFGIWVFRLWFWFCDFWFFHDFLLNRVDSLTQSFLSTYRCEGNILLLNRKRIQFFFNRKFITQVQDRLIFFLRMISVFNHAISELSAEIIFILQIFLFIRCEWN